MRAFLAFFKKELLEYSRSGKLILFGILFVLFGIMNPAIAKLTPWLMETMAAELAQSGMSVTAIEPDAMASWVQFFKNIPMALIVFVLVMSNVFTKEYASATLILMLTKGVARYKVYLAKAGALLLLWSVGYAVCFAVTYVYTDYFWDQSILHHLVPTVLHWYLFGVFCICLVLLFSTVANTQTTVLLLTGASVLASYLAGMLPKIKHLMPTALMNSAALLVGKESPQDYLRAIILTLAMSCVALIAAIPLFNKKAL